MVVGSKFLGWTGRLVVVILVLSVAHYCVHSATEALKEIQIEQATYDALSAVEKAAVYEKMAQVRKADYGDFLFLKNGKVYFIRGVSHYSDGSIYVRFQSSINGLIDDGRLFNSWSFYAAVDRLVRKTDPDAGKVALKFLNQ